MGNRNVSAVGYGNFQRAMRDRSAFFAKMAASAPAEPGTSGVSTIVARNFRLVRPIPVPTGYRGSGISYEVKCIGEGHPEFFGDQSYVLKAIHGLTTTGVQGALENESLIAATLEPHPNISQYFCHFTDHIPQEYCHHIPQEYKELAFDTVHKRMKPCVWVVLEHHSETMEQFLRHLNSTVAPQNATATTTLITATPWAIVHKYSRDICAALVHLFLNHTIYFDIKLDNIAVSSNKEQAILVDFGSASKFPKADSSTGSTFEIEATSLTSVLVNQSHTAPEIVNGIANSKRNPDSSSILSCYKQPSFELGCILFELAMFGQHPLPGYPAAYGQSGECQVTFSLESEENFPLKPPAFPKEFCNLVRSLLQCDPEKRMPLLEASEVLSNIDPPCPYDLLSFYDFIVPPLTCDAGTLTTKATCQILCGYSAKDCSETLNKALESEPLFSPALLLLLYIKFCSAEQKWDFQFKQQVHRAFTGKTATFTSTDVEFTRAIINKKHRTTLPELVLTALWTRHISQQAEDFNNVTQLILEKIPTGTLHMWHQQHAPFSFSATTRRFLRTMIHTRNEIMMEALFQLDLGNIDCALDLVADATFLFDCELKLNRTKAQVRQSHQYKYVPGLLFLYCLRCIINDHVSLHEHIPPSLQKTFSCSLSGEEEMGAYKSEWTDLVTTVETKGQVDQQTTTPTATEESHLRLPACMYYVAMWRMVFSEGNQRANNSAAHIWEKMSSGISMTFDTHHPISSAALQTHWGASALSRLGVCFHLGIGGVGKDMGKAVSIYQKAADAGDSTAIHDLAMCYVTGNGVERDPRKAVTLLQRAADYGNIAAMSNLGVCFNRGIGVDIDMRRAVSLWRRAAYAGESRAMCNLGVSFQNGTGVSKDISKGLRLFLMAAGCDNGQAMFRLGWCIQNGIGVEKDMHSAVSYYKRAAEYGDAQALCYLGELYQNGTGVGRDIHKAAELFEKSVLIGGPASSNSNAACNLARCYEQGSGVDKDIHKAVELYKRAADAGYAVALYRLGVCFWNGKGVSKDIRNAVSLYRLAAHLGNDSAVVLLTELLDSQVPRTRFFFF